MKLKTLWYYLSSVIVVTLVILITSATFNTHPQRNQKRTAGIVKFNKALAEAGMVYTPVAGFKEAGNYAQGNSDFDYGLTLPGQDFEIWFQLTPLKQSWQSYERAQAENKQPGINPDSAYLKAGKFKAEALSADGTYFERNLRPNTLDEYNADAGKTYLVDIKDSPATKHYSYALLITLQKNHVGNVLVMCLTNDRGPAFFRNINRLKNCLKFK
ncbi:hypothetical protein GCM10027037_01400 [Mucilaginibacter koreensis]